jgi:hypothetical protein
MNSFQKLTALLYLTTHAFMGTEEDEGIELYIVYHLLHPTGRGLDIQPLMYGGNTTQCYENMDSNNKAILTQIVQVLIPQLITTEMKLEDIRVFLCTKIANLADEFREKIPQPSHNVVLAIAPVLFENWHPTPAQQELYDLVQNLLRDDSTSSDDDFGGFSDDDSGSDMDS